MPLESFGFDLNTLSREQAVGVPTVLVLLAAAAAVGLSWNWRVWLLLAAAFYVPYALLFTSFGTYGSGSRRRTRASLAVWLDQHGVRRGRQPATGFGKNRFLTSLPHARHNPRGPSTRCAARCFTNPLRVETIRASRDTKRPAESYGAPVCR